MNDDSPIINPIIAARIIHACARHGFGNATRIAADGSCVEIDFGVMVPDGAGELIPAVVTERMHTLAECMDALGY